MSAESNKAIAHRFFDEVVNQGDLDAINTLLAQDYVQHDGPTTTDLEGFKQFIARLAAAFPDLQVAVEDTIAEGAKVAVRLTVRGTHRGHLMDTFPPTGKQATWTGIDIIRVADNKIIERWSERNLLGMLQQLGFTPK